MGKQKNKTGKRKQNNVYLIAFVIMLAAVMAVVLFVAVRKQNTVSLNPEKAQTAGSTEEAEEKWQEGMIRYKGRNYRYNNAIRTYLYMGIDKDEKVAVSENKTDGGQSDAMFLLIVNNKTKELSVLSINRNTMTDVDVYESDGTFFGTYRLQICLQHGYGDGARTSCTRSAEAVSNLLYQLPIHGYLAMNMGGIPIVNDAVGGVTVEILQNLENREKGVFLKKGEEVTLTGNEAYVYLRSRDTGEFDSASKRLLRQQQYIMALMKKMNDTGVGKMLEIYDSASEYIVTDIDFQKLAEEVKACEFDSSRMYSVPGKTVMGTEYEEYHVDEDALYELMIEIFYEPVS